MKLLISILLLCVSISGCTAILVGVGGTMAVQEKRVGDSINDNTIWAHIKSDFINQELDDLWGKITVSVSEGRVLLTGSLSNPRDLVKILKIVWKQEGVRDVINELEVSKTKEDRGFSGHAQDFWITTQIKSNMLISKKVHIKTINYSVETIKGVVYLFGIAKNQEEIQAVEDIAYSVSGVKDVRSHMRVKEDEVRNRLKKLIQHKNSNPTAESNQNSVGE